MGDVVTLKPRGDIKAATCGCGGQTFILVTDAGEQPDFVYCTECQRRQALISWAWVEPRPQAPAA